MARTKQTARKRIYPNNQIDDDENNNNQNFNVMDENNRNDIIQKFLVEHFLIDEENNPNNPNLNLFHGGSDNKPLTDLCIMLQEFSRRSMTWPLINIGRFVEKRNGYLYEDKVGVPIEQIRRRRRGMFFYNQYNNDDERFKDGIDDLIATEVIEMLMKNEGEMILAGGSITDMMRGKQPKDFDLFCIGKRPHINLDGMIETVNSYTTIKYPKMQIIKRIYSTPEEVIGGFDLEPSKFLMDANLEVFCTVGALISLKNHMNPINFNSYSSTFMRRINKYERKGFYPVWVNKKREEYCCNTRRKLDKLNDESSAPVYFSDYSANLSHIESINFQDKIFKLNFSCLMRNEKDGYCIANGVVTPKSTFLQHAKELYDQEKHVYDIKRYFYQKGSFFPRLEQAKTFSDLNVSRWESRNYGNGDSQIAKFIYCMRVKNIENNYSEYVSIVDKFRISNPGSQHTSSFHPIQFKTLEERSNFLKKFFGKNYKPHDHSTPDVLTFLMCAKKMKLPRPITYLVGCFLCAFKLLDTIARVEKVKSGPDFDSKKSLNEKRKLSLDDNLDDIPRKGIVLSGGKKQVCKYGSSCYRKNPQHFLEFDHPWKKEEDDEGNEDIDEDDDE